jgi:2-keto-4-pentenoate hydratase/2-oxohepta-3-ene-1,7-dioic acid hydratase in catechol pathway
VTPPDVPRFGWNPELGVVIGKGGKYIDVDRAREHIAGLTVVLDMNIGDYYKCFDPRITRPPDWFADATASWLGKKADTMCPMGPYLTTLDEIDDIYDLLIYTRQSGWLRDRSHTNSMLIGVEELISWLSTFTTLYPGDVLHMATMGLDGVPMTPDMRFGPEDRLEGEIERVGTLLTPVVEMARDDWRAPDDPGRTVHASPAVRDLIESGQTSIAAPASWSLADVRHFWTTYGNYRDAPEVEGMRHDDYPRVLNGPTRSLAASGEPVTLAHRARTLHVGPELALVVGRLAYRVPEEQADDYILGYLAMASILDSSFDQTLREPITTQARAMPGVYGRWGDGYNVVSTPPVPLAAEGIRGRKMRGRNMRLCVDGIGEVATSTNEYLLLAPRILAFLSSHITLFPGDVITFGRIAERLTVPEDRHLPAGTMLRASIEGIGEVCSPLVDERRR